MSGELVLFILFGALAVAGAVLVIVARNPVYSALGLLLNFCMLGALYILLNAQFVGIVQIIVYAGAVMVLFLFTLMLVGERRGGPVRSSAAAVFGVVLALVLLAEVGYAVATQAVGGAKGGMTPEVLARVGNVQALGTVLFTEYLLPFELASVLLLVGILGAVYLARRRLAREG
ncbi:MAG: NADH-quinone oxidoreductase subunit J [Anaerolineae bacterium]